MRFSSPYLNIVNKVFYGDGGVWCKCEKLQKGGVKEKHESVFHRRSFAGTQKIYMHTKVKFKMLANALLKQGEFFYCRASYFLFVPVLPFPDYLYFSFFQLGKKIFKLKTVADARGEAFESSTVCKGLEFFGTTKSLSEGTKLRKKKKGKGDRFGAFTCI